MLLKRRRNFTLVLILKKIDENKKENKKIFVKYLMIES